MLDKVGNQLSDFQIKISNLGSLNSSVEKQRNKVQNLRAQVDEIESQNSRVLQEEENYKKLYKELKGLTSHIKINSDIQTQMVKGDYNDDEALPVLLDHLQKLKASLAFNPEGKSKGPKAALMEMRYVQDLN